MKKEAEKRNYLGEEWFLAFKIVTFLLVGFLPSFLFVLLFVQYGSPIVNYVNFLADLKSSWLAWISAIVISFLLHFIDRLIRLRKKIKTKIEKKFLILIIFSSIMVFGLIATQAYLYVNYLLLNDTLVKLSADENNIFFTDNINQDITFKISVTANPFCSAECRYNFSDVSIGKEIDSGSFNLTTVFSKLKKYSLINAHLVHGSQVLNRFEVSCKSKKTFLCYTGEEESKRAVLITLNYNLSREDLKFRNNSRDQIILIGKNLSFISEKLADSNAGLFSINNSFDSENLQDNYKNLSYSFLKLNDSFYFLKNLWESQNFSFLKKEMPKINNQTNNLSTNFGELNSEINSNISFYNSLIENITYSGKILQTLSLMNIDTLSCSKLNNLVSNFNQIYKRLNGKINLTYDGAIMQNTSSEIETFYGTVPTNPVNPLCSLTENISNVNISKIEIASANFSRYEISLNDPSPVCCVQGKCDVCCEKQCSKENYPVIFLHGHLINKALPADYSLDSFTAIKEKLNSEGYVDAGSVVLSKIQEPMGLWGKTDARIIVTASYFFDTNETANGEITFQSDDKDIETYAARLNRIVELVKYRTGKDKVVIVAHSMGGVVTRKYLQTFGGENVDKIILVTVPNHGIDGKTRDYCALLGAEVACKEMDKDSAFMKDLNSQSSAIVPAYNIVGVGCNMGDETGDGIIKNSSQYLSYAVNYQIRGTCNELGFQYLHEYVVYPEKYPETYVIIRDILRKN